MPLFDFICDDCQHEYELLIGADVKPKCPDCGSRRMVKQLSAFAPRKARTTAPPMTCGAPSCCGMRGGCLSN